MDHTLTTVELADALDKTVAYVNSLASRGCPHEKITLPNGRVSRRWNLDAVLAFRATLRTYRKKTDSEEIDRTDPEEQIAARLSVAIPRSDLEWLEREAKRMAVPLWRTVHELVVQAAASCVA